MEPNHSATLLLAVVGVIILLGLTARTLLSRIYIPATASFILIGLALSGIDGLIGFKTPALEEGIGLLAQLGIVVLLFRVGLESDLDMLYRQLSNAALIWVPNVALPACLAFAVVYWWPEQGLLPALFTAVAASATSIGVSTAVWDEAGMLHTEEGALLVDVAELDDLSAVIFMSLLFGLAPVFASSGEVALLPLVTSTAGVLLLKFAAFCTACYLFSRFLESHLTAWFAHQDRLFGPVLFATGCAVLIAAAAELLGFSLAIGALFAGLAFSRDPAERQIDRAFARIFSLFSPFFFVAIGLSVSLSNIQDSILLAFALVTAMSVGKLAGAGLPAAQLTSPKTGFLIGLSMIPRAEIFLIIMLHGLTNGGYLSEKLYTAAVLVCLATSIVAPVAMRMVIDTNTSRKSN